MDRSERMKLKIILIIVGIGVLITLLMINLKNPRNAQQEETPVKAEDVIDIWKNAWIVGSSEEDITLFYANRETRFPYTGEDRKLNEQIADITFVNGEITEIKVKTEKVGGKLVSIKDNAAEIEGVGTIPFDEDCVLLKLHGALAECSFSDLVIGYDFTDFVIADGKICACLVTRDGAMEKIRVLLKTTDFADIYHESVVFYGDTDIDVINGETTQTYGVGEVVTLNADSEFPEGNRIYIIPKVLTGKITLSSVRRSQGTPSYRGILEVEITEKGFLIVNELLLEEYLYAVVPSEMPASYPTEALKAQAICARTYAYASMQQSTLAAYGAHADDSTGYQVYNNIEEQPAATNAVKETKGTLLYAGDSLAGAYYYSTSCGFGTNGEVWYGNTPEAFPYLFPQQISEEKIAEETSAEAGADASDKEVFTGETMKEETVFAEYINAVHPSDFESNEAWYRWSAEVKKIDVAEMEKRLKARYAINHELILSRDKNGVFVSREFETLGKIKDIRVLKRGGGGVIEELLIEGTKETVKIIKEYNVRYVLTDGQVSVVRQDGSTMTAATLLPSAYFIIEPTMDKGNVVGYSIKGGGYGHGVGMSQNGAKAMADREYLCDDILTFFYKGVTIQKIY